MRRISKIGAAALALVLSVSFLNPTTVHAVRADDKTIIIGVSELVANDTYDSKLITTDVRRIAEFATKQEAENAYKAAGYTATAGYDIKQWAKGGKDLYVITYTVYKNEITGAASVNRSDVDPSKKTQTGFTRTVYINKGEVTKLMVMTGNGGINIKNVKSSNKKIFTAKVNRDDYYKYETNDNAAYEKDEFGNYCYYTSTGTKVIIPKNADGTCNEDSYEYRSSNGSMACLSIKVTPLKAGSANLKFNVLDRTGVSTPVTVKVIVRDDDQPFKTFTYGGISLIQKKYGDSKYVDNGRAVGASNSGYIRYGKGKVVVKANKGYKIVKIEVGKLREKDLTGIGNPYDGVYENVENDEYSGTGSTTTTSAPIDLNGDGDFLDVVGGIHENNPGNAFRFTKIKSGKTITLSRVAPYIDSVETLNCKKYRNKNGELVYSKLSTKLKKNLAPTVIRVTYQDCDTREYKVVTKTIQTTAQRDDD